MDELLRKLSWLKIQIDILENALLYSHHNYIEYCLLNIKPTLDEINDLFTNIESLKNKDGLKM